PCTARSRPAPACSIWDAAPASTRSNSRGAVSTWWPPTGHRGWSSARRRAPTAPRRQPGVFGDGPDLPVGAGSLRLARPLQARRRARSPWRDGGGDEPADDLDLLLPAARVLPRLRRTLFARELSRAEPVHAACLP